MNGFPQNLLEYPVHFAKYVTATPAKGSLIALAHHAEEDLECM